MPLAESGETFLTYTQAMSHAWAAMACIHDAVLEDDGKILIPGPKHLEGSMVRRCY